jgi:glutamate:Na+ symporter, ESS family
MQQITIQDFGALTIGILVYMLGVHLTRRSKMLRDYNIPEPVTGGLLAAMAVFVIYLAIDVEVSFDLQTRDRLLVYFFTGIGLNARFSDLVKGGKPLLILLVLTVSYIVIQNIVGVGGAMLVDLERPVGVLAGSVSLIGGHGTAIAWAPDIRELGVGNALEIGVASATLGLIVASLIGGPIARFLLERYQLKADEGEKAVMGISYETAESESINHLSIMKSLLIIHLAIIIGYSFNEYVSSMGFKLPLFVSCLLSAILLSNTIPHLLPKIAWPARTRALALISDFSLGLFLAMSLMSMQLWTLAGLGGPLITILVLQALATTAVILLVFFRIMGSDYTAAVLSAGFAGFTLGATPTAIANMSSVTKSYGPAPLAFIVLPLVSAFFVDVANALIIGWFAAF